MTAKQIMVICIDCGAEQPKGKLKQCICGGVSFREPGRISHTLLAINFNGIKKDDN